MKSSASVLIFVINASIFRALLILKVPQPVTNYSVSLLCVKVDLNQIYNIEAADVFLSQTQTISS
jgi:uncharacterized membrane protein